MEESYNVLFKPVEDVLSIGKSSILAIKRLGIYNLRDLLFYLPKSYIIYNIFPNLSKLEYGKLIIVKIFITKIEQFYNRSVVLNIHVRNDSGRLTLTFFRRPPLFLIKRLQIGSEHVISGKVQYYNNEYQISHPEFIFNNDLITEVMPLYRLTYKVNNKQLYEYIIKGIKFFDFIISNSKKNFNNNNEQDQVDYNSRKELIYLKELVKEIKDLHLINSSTDCSVISAQRKAVIKKLAYKELFANQIALYQIKTSLRRKKKVYQINTKVHDDILRNLGFKLTDDQERVIKEIIGDQKSPWPMMRLLQGDVGSGKTLVALLTIAHISIGGIQSVLMAPTALLSKQHYSFFQKALLGTSITVVLLTGNTTLKNKKIIKEEIKKGKVDIVIGTHTLFQKDLEFYNLKYIVIDEQHKFGVEQRLELINKSSSPDLLVMTATPIPRSLTLTMFGDMSISKIRNKPKNRGSINTIVIPINKRHLVIDAIRKKLDLREKVYWVCPLINKNDKLIDDKNNIKYANVEDSFAELERIYSGKVGILHGKTNKKDQEQVVQDYKLGRIQIIVSTTVIEVGIDNTDSTLMVIENAEKFGLTQLHQLRGRVGRGHLASDCILMYNPKNSSHITKSRLNIIKKSYDGFYIAEQDLILRGGGEIIGTKQSGTPEFFFADLSKDLDILVKINKIIQDEVVDDFIKFQEKLFNRNSIQLVNSG